MNINECFEVETKKPDGIWEHIIYVHPNFRFKVVKPWYYLWSPVIRFKGVPLYDRLDAYHDALWAAEALTRNTDTQFRIWFHSGNGKRQLWKSLLDEVMVM